MTTLTFAHVTDVHISETADSWGAMGLEAPRILRECFARLNMMDDLDFVLITGDVVDQARPAELALFLDALATLEKPWHFVPGNHDGFLYESNRAAMLPAEIVSAIDPRLAGLNPDANLAYWSRTAARGVQLIGLDSRIATDWGGTISANQLDWLSSALNAHTDSLVILAVHHPLRKLGMHNEREWWDKFITANGAIVERLLDQHPNVKMVISGHHHANHIRIRGGRLHMTTASLTGYPCVYRTVRLELTEDGWYAHIETHTAADDDTLADAREAMMSSKTAFDFDPRGPMAWVGFCVGLPRDLSFDGLLAGDDQLHENQ
jgi:3',5'-cyclic AMP phosphodiesterase CpdA